MFAIAIAAKCAGAQGRFAVFHDEAFRQTQILRYADAWERLGALAEIPDWDEYAECVRSRQYASEVIGDFAEAQSMGIPGTPGILTLNRLWVGELSVAGLDSLIVAQLR